MDYRLIKTERGKEMKKKLSLFAVLTLCAFCLVLAGGVAPADAEDVIANPTTSKVKVNGKEVTVDAYTIDGANYFKLRDFAAAVDVGVWFDSANDIVNVDTGLKYDANYTRPETAVTPAPSEKTTVLKSSVFPFEVELIGDWQFLDDEEDGVVYTLGNTGVAYCAYMEGDFDLTDAERKEFLASFSSFAESENLKEVTYVKNISGFDVIQYVGNVSDSDLFFTFAITNNAFFCIFYTPDYNENFINNADRIQELSTYVKSIKI